MDTSNLAVRYVATMGIRDQINKLANGGEEAEYEKSIDKVELKERLTGEQFLSLIHI